MKTFRQTLAVLALACIAPLAQAYTISVAPTSVQVGDTVVLNVDGTFDEIYAFDVKVDFDAAAFHVGAGALLSPTEVDPYAIIDSGISGAASVFGFDGVIGGGSFSITYIANPDPLYVTNGRILSIPFVVKAASIAAFSVELCVLGPNDACDRASSSVPPVPLVLGPLSVAIVGTPGRTPEPGSLLLLGAAVLGAAAVARTRRN